MAVINALKEQYASGVNSLSFTPRSGTAAIIKLIAINAAAADFAKVTAMNTTIGIFEVGPAARNHLDYTADNQYGINFMQDLKEKGIETAIPVAEGEVFSIETTNNMTNLIIRYEEVDPGDVKPGMANYPGSAKQLKLLYGTNNADITASGYFRFDKSLNPTEMHNWPFAEVNCPFEKISVIAVGMLNVSQNVYTTVNNISSTSKTRFWKGTKQLFTSGTDGFITAGTGAVTGSSNTVFGKGTNEMPYVSTRNAGSMLVLPEALDFVRGDEFAIEQYITVAAASKISAGNLRCCLIGKLGK